MIGTILSVSNAFLLFHKIQSYVVGILRDLTATTLLLLYRNLSV